MSKTQWRCLLSFYGINRPFFAFNWLNFATKRWNLDSWLNSNLFSTKFFPNRTTFDRLGTLFGFTWKLGFSLFSLFRRWLYSAKFFNNPVAYWHELSWLISFLWSHAGFWAVVNFLLRILWLVCWPPFPWPLMQWQGSSPGGSLICL